MGTSISIGLYSDRNLLSREIPDLGERLLAKSSIDSAYLAKRWSYNSPQKLSGEEAIAKLLSLAKSVERSDEALTMRLEYELSSHRFIPLDVCLYGNNYRGGGPARVDGYLKLIIPYNDLACSLDEVRKKGEAFHNTTIDLFIVMLNDVEELFFRACGIDLYKQKCSGITHAAMYLESGWPSAVGCSTLYHKDITEFARDFVRIFVEYNFGIAIPATLPSDADLWSFSKSPDVEPLRQNPRFYQQFWNEGDGALIRFLDSLDESRVRQLATLKKEKIREYFMQAGEDLPDLICYDLNDSGMALATLPMASIWQAYEFVAHRSQL
jgi:hypothetical protein